MKKVLIIITTAFSPYGGLTTVMMNYYRAMDKNNLNIDFASTNNAPQSLINEITVNGSHYFNLGGRKKNLYAYIKNLSHLLKNEQYDVIHVNGNSATMFIELVIAKKHNVRTRIAHCHTSQSSYSFIGIIQVLLKKFFNKTYTQAIAVSSIVGDRLYDGKNYMVLKNAIDVEKYKYNENKRCSLRNMLNIDNKFVVGNLGKLYQPKNHEFLLEVFYALKKICSNAILLLVGGGELETKLRNKCIKLGISNDVIFTNMVDNPQDYLQAMDIFVFPSLWEGLPLALIEAQVAGLKCLVSTNITKDAKCTENIIYKDLSDGSVSWSYEIIKLNSIKTDRYNVLSDIKKYGYDIDHEAIKLKNLYLS